MHIVRDLNNLPELPNGSVVAIGNFDSVHLGHQQIIKALVAEATARNLPSIVMVFEPQAREFFQGERAPVRLSTFRAKAECFQEFGVDIVLVIRFASSFATLTPDQFIQQYLVDCLNARYLIVGDDFHFGKNHEGDFRFLKKFSKKYDFYVEESKTFILTEVEWGEKHSRRVSSTWIRESIKANDFRIVGQLLDHPYTICGRVAHGDKRGRALGFPTANIFLKHNLSPVLGIYVVNVQGLDHHTYQGVASIGKRPTFGCKRTVLEVYLLDFDEDIYGRRICIEFLHKLREEKSFASADELIVQMKQDEKEARKYFAS